LNVAPKPSRPVADAGAVTQLRLKKLLPTAKARRYFRDSFGTDSANALAVLSTTVASTPPDMASRLPPSPDEPRLAT